MAPRHRAGRHFVSVLSGEKFGKGSENSHDPIAPIRIDAAVAGLANMALTTWKATAPLRLSG